MGRTWGFNFYNFVSVMNSSIASCIYNSSFPAPPSFVVPSAGKQTAGVDTLNKYSHFSGSITDNKAFVGAQTRSTCIPRQYRVRDERDGTYLG